MACAPEIRTAPTVFEMGVTVQICTQGMPAFSNSFTIVAPQRVQVPQVDVRIAAETCASNSSCAIFCPIRIASETAVELPVVDIKKG